MLRYRKFDKESDYDIMRSILQHNCMKTGHLYPQLHIGNLDFERYSFEESPDILYKTAWLISDEKMEIGFITIQEEEFFITVLSEFRHLTNNILDYIEGKCFMSRTTITTEANSKDKFLSIILKERGYIKTDYFRFCGICDLSKIQLYPPLPGGFIIRLTQRKDVARRVELFPIAAGGRGTTLERYERMMNSPSYGDAMDFVVETINEEIIAYCTIWDDPLSKTAILEPVACVEKYRRKGIMKSTLLYGMNLLKERGTKFIYVGTGGKNSASQALYKSVGFLEYGANYEWQKSLKY
ncbi:GNAT family N-acetyltransferase [Candidatus Clostridium stratigraminis]|uniref:GNAT family N-acetyltransferase n=1 Tax=Candidatus Clostridium stratigraminis TaxID=3381661 RepID=A0ABW8T7V2_9CLOT